MKTKKIPIKLKFKKKDGTSMVLNAKKIVEVKKKKDYEKRHKEVMKKLVKTNKMLGRRRKKVRS